MWTLSDRSPRAIPLADYPVSAGQVIGTAFDDAIDNNPIPLLMQAMELNRLKNTGPKMPKDQAQAEAARLGVAIAIPQDGMTPQALDFFAQRRKDDLNKQMVFNRSPGGMATAGSFAAGFAGTLLDPINLAAGFIPVLGGTKYAAAIEKAGSAAARAGVRAVVGAGEGLVGAAAVEIPTITLRGDLQDDYTLGDSLANIAFGTFASSGLRAGGGAIADAWGGVRRARAAEADQARIAQEQLDRGIDQDLAFGSERGAGFSEGDVAFNQFDRDFATDRQYAEEPFILLEREIADAEARSAEAGRKADASIYNRMRRALDEEYQAGVRLVTDDSPGMTPPQIEDAYQKARSRIDEDRKLLSSAEAAERRFLTDDLESIKKKLASGEGKLIVPSTAKEIEAAIGYDTHVAALRASVAQAVDGRRVDPTAVVRQDTVFGAQRLSEQETKLMAEADQRPENKVAADKGASDRAEAQVALTKAKPQEGIGVPPELAELQRLATEAEARAKAALPEGKDLPEMKDRSLEYEKAWKAVADCLEGKA